MNWLACELSVWFGFSLKCMKYSAVDSPVQSCTVNSKSVGGKSGSKLMLDVLEWLGISVCTGIRVIDSLRDWN